MKYVKTKETLRNLILSLLAMLFMLNAQNSWAVFAFVNSGQLLQVNNAGSQGVAIGDLDGDGDLDAFTATYHNNPDKVYFNDGKGNFVDSGQNIDPNNTYSNIVLLSDFDKDGDLDAFVLHNGGSPSKVFWNDGKGKFTDSGQQLYSPDGWGADLGDLDGDGDLDIFVVSPFNQYAQVWVNQGKGIFQDSGQKLYGNPHGHDIVLGDVDKDGDLDAFVGNEQSSKLWLNNGKGIFTLSPQSIGTVSGVVALADVDGDSDLDAVIGGGVGKPSEIWLNDGKGNFIDSQQRLGNGGAMDVAVADLDRDGDLDIFISTGYNNKSPEEIWLNTGKGVFIDSGQKLGSWDNAFVALSDLDGDGDLDAFISGNQLGGQGDEIWFNQLIQLPSCVDQAKIDAAKQAGIDQCKTNPASCGITLTDTNGSTQTGIDQCKANPVSCGIIVSTDQCKTNPASCNLFTQAQIDAAKQACKTDPASCGLFTQAQIDAAKQAAIAQCKTTPASCGITLIDNNGSTQAGIAQCKTNPASCGITKLDGISTNAFITPANKMIAGVLISGGTKRLMVRASSIDGMVDPQLDIVTYPDRKPLGSNDSWAIDPAAAELTQKKLAPGRATDAATIINLPPGLFTMEITSKNGGSGAGIIEVYDMAVFP